MPSRFNPAPHQTITLKQMNYVVQPHPSAVGVAFSAEGRKGTVYNIARSGIGDTYALKVFKVKYRQSGLLKAASRLKQFENFEGLSAARRSVIEPTEPIVTQYPDLMYAMLMPWVGGSTWFDVLSELRARGPVFDSELAFALCIRFLSVVNGLEQVGVAHTDISPGNVAINEKAKDVQLLDLEDLYVSGSPQPHDKNKGSTGYNHPSSDLGRSTWCREGDRYASAILASEMILAVDRSMSARASDTGFFGGNRNSQVGLDTFDEAYPYLTSVAPRFATLFAKAWNSGELSQCPTIGELHSAVSTDAASAPRHIAGVKWVKTAAAGSSGTISTGRSQVSSPLPSGPPASPRPVLSTPGVSWGAVSVTPAPSPSGPSAPIQSGSTSVSLPAALKSAPSGVGGWLALFIFGLLVLNPLEAVFNLSTSDGIVALLSLGFAGFSVFAGFRLWKRPSSRSVGTAKWFLGFAIAYSTILLVSGESTTEAFLNLIASGILFLYLKASERVLATYGTN